MARVAPAVCVADLMAILSATPPAKQWLVESVPVFEGENILDIISINDVVKETILIQQETISQLKDYLHASL